jgi:hypothetical protein
MRAAEIARRRRKSRAHVSILLRLGQALGSCTPEELAVLRSPRVTWKLVQGLVRADLPEAVLRERLRLAIGGFSSYTLDRRRHRKGRRTGADPLDAPAGTFVWQWDPVWAGRDPVGYVEAYRAFLARMHRDVTARLRVRIGGTRAGATPLVGQSLRQLSMAFTRPGSASQTRPPSTEERDALTRLAELDGTLIPRRVVEGSGDE